MLQLVNYYGTRPPAPRMEEDDWRPVNQAFLDNLWTIYNQDGVLQACRAAVFNRLLSGGVAFVDASFAAVADEDFHTRVQTHFVPFARDLIDCLYVQGFAAFYVDAKSGYPHVLPHRSGTFTVCTDKKHLRRRMAFVRPGESDPDKRALFVVENWPDHNGMATGALASYRRLAGFKMMVEINTAIADYGRARPLVYTSSRTDHVFNKKFVYPPEKVYADTWGWLDDKSKNQDELQSRRDTAAQFTAGTNAAATRQAYQHEDLLFESSRQQQMLVRDLNYGLLDGRDIRMDPMSGLPVFDSQLTHAKEASYNVVPLPMDVEKMQPVLPDSRRDLVQLMDHTARHACMVMGVPALSVGLDSTHVSAGVTNSEHVLRSTLGRFRQILSRVFADVFTSLYGKKDGLVVIFPSLATDDEMRNLYDRQVLSYDAYKRYVTRILTVNPADLEQADPRGAQQRPRLPAGQPLKPEELVPA